MSRATKIVEFAGVRIPWTPDLQALLDLVGWGRTRGGSFDEGGHHTSLTIETSDGDEVTIDVVEAAPDLADRYEEGLRAAYDLAIEADRVNERWAADGLDIRNGPLDVAAAILQRIWSHRGTLAYRFVSASDPEHVMIGHVAEFPKLPAYVCVCGGKTDMQPRGRAFEDAGPDRCLTEASSQLLDTELLPDGRTLLTARAPGGVTLWRAGKFVCELACGQSMDVRSVDGYVVQTRGPR